MQKSLLQLESPKGGGRGGAGVQWFLSLGFFKSSLGKTQFRELKQTHADEECSSGMKLS